MKKQGGAEPKKSWLELGEGVLKRCEPTHSSGGAHVLYHSIKDKRYFCSSGDFADLVWFSTDEGYCNDETTYLKTSDAPVYLVFNQVNVLPHIL